MRLHRRVSARNEDEGQTRATVKDLFKREHDGLILKELQNGAGINSRDKLEGATPLHLAIRRWLLVPAVERQSALVLLSKGANPNMQDTFGITPLHLSVVGRDLKVVESLVKWGADATCTSYYDSSEDEGEWEQILKTLKNIQGATG